MADENQVVEGENKEEVSQTVEMSPVETQAREAGWVSEDEYTGEKEKWVSAAEFVRRGELFKKIDNQSRKLKDMERAIQDIQALHAKSRETEYKRALATVRAEKKAALEDGDADAVIEADERLDMLRDAQRENNSAPQQASSGGESHPEFVAWVAKNSWYESNKGMKAFADTVGAEMRNNGMSPSEVLRAVEKQVREEFPRRFNNPNQNKPNAVEGGAVGGRSAGKESYQLSPQERTIMNNLVRLGVMTEKDYVAELKKVNEA